MIQSGKVDSFFTSAYLRDLHLGGWSLFFTSKPHLTNLWQCSDQKWACPNLKGYNDSLGRRSQMKQVLMQNKSTLHGLMLCYSKGTCAWGDVVS